MRRARVFERYTEEARRAVFFARAEAVHSKAGFITAAHLLQGLMWDQHLPTCPIAALKMHEVELRTFLNAPARSEIKKPLDLKEGIGLDQDAKKILAWTVREANCDGQFWIDACHILRGILLVPGEASSAVASIPLDLDELRAQSKRHRVLYPPKKAPWSYYAQKVGRGVLLAAVSFGIAVVAMFLILALLDLTRILFHKS